MDLVALDTDVLTLELGSCFFDAWHDEDSTSLFYTARALMKLQVMYGFFPHVRAFGAKGKAVGEMVLRMRREMGEEEAVGVAPEMDAVIIVDRQVDLLSVLATQKTYEGLVSEIFTITNSHCDLDSEIVAVGEDRNKKLPPKVKAKQTRKSGVVLSSDMPRAVSAQLGRRHVSRSARPAHLARGPRAAEQGARVRRVHPQKGRAAQHHRDQKLCQEAALGAGHAKGHRHSRQHCQAHGPHHALASV
jgi:hypothetical protein